MTTPRPFDETDVVEADVLIVEVGPEADVALASRVVVAFDEELVVAVDTNRRTVDLDTPSPRRRCPEKVGVVDAGSRARRCA